MNSPSARATGSGGRILVVDDDDASRADFVGTLRQAGYEVAEAWSATQGMRLLLSYRPDVAVLDLVLPDGHGIEIGRAMRAIVTTARTCVVAVTSSEKSIGLVDPKSFGAVAILIKPVPAERLLASVAHCLGAPIETDTDSPPELPARPRSDTV